MQQLLPKHDLLNPYPWYAYMREHHPVYQDKETGLWHIFRYEDVLHVLNPPAKPTAECPIIFSSNISAVARPHIPLHDSMISLDFPAHKRIRDLTTCAFSPSTLQRYVPRLTSLIDGLLDQVMDAGQMEVVSAFAYPLPTLVITELLGIPPEDRTHFRRWAEPLLIAGESLMTQPPQTPELDAYLMRLIEQRRREDLHDRTDLLSTLILARVQEEEPLSDAELLGNCELLLLAGYETTVVLLTNLFRILDEFPHIQQEVWADPALIPAVIEETLRFYAPVLFQARVTTQESIVGDTVIPAHQMVVPLLGSANRDERKFVDPDRFLLGRSNATEHVAFGFRGPHFCLGAPLARLEARLALGRLIARLHDIQRDHTIPLENFSPLTSGVKRLQVTFKPR